MARGYGVRRGMLVKATWILRSRAYGIGSMGSARLNPAWARGQERDIRVEGYNAMLG
jgi:hypothetical protein